MFSILYCLALDFHIAVFRWVHLFPYYKCLSDRGNFIWSVYRTSIALFASRFCNGLWLQLLTYLSSLHGSWMVADWAWAHCPTKIWHCVKSRFTEARDRSELVHWRPTAPGQAESQREVQQAATGWAPVKRFRMSTQVTGINLGFSAALGSTAHSRLCNLE